MVNNSVLWLSKIKIMDEILPTFINRENLNEKLSANIILLLLLLYKGSQKIALCFGFNNQFLSDRIPDLIILFCPPYKLTPVNKNLLNRLSFSTFCNFSPFAREGTRLNRRCGDPSKKQACPDLKQNSEHLRISNNDYRRSCGRWLRPPKNLNSKQSQIDNWAFYDGFLRHNSTKYRLICTHNELSAYFKYIKAFTQWTSSQSDLHQRI